MIANKEILGSSMSAYDFSSIMKSSLANGRIPAGEPGRCRWEAATWMAPHRRCRLAEQSKLHPLNLNLDDFSGLAAVSPRSGIIQPFQALA
jgi:hypothetical protein